MSIRYYFIMVSLSSGSRNWEKIVMRESSFFRTFGTWNWMCAWKIDSFFIVILFIFYYIILNFELIWICHNYFAAMNEVLWDVQYCSYDAWMNEVFYESECSLKNRINRLNNPNKFMRYIVNYLINLEMSSMWLIIF